MRFYDSEEAVTIFTPMLLDELTPITSDRFWDAPLKVVLGGLFLALVAPIELSLSLLGSEVVPITLQSLIVLMLACLLGAWRSSLAVLLYLVLGALGLPVFANGGAGWSHLIGPTGGFLFGFVWVAWLAGRAAEQPWGQRLWGLLSIALGGHLLILVPGGIWYGVAKSPDIFLSALPSLWPGLLIKSVLGAVLIWLINSGLRLALRSRNTG